MRQKIETSSAAEKGIVHSAAPTKTNTMIQYQKDENGLFTCPHCDYKKSNQSTMHYHMKKHQEELTHQCKLCKKGFLQKQTLDLHMRSKHPEHTKTKGEDAKKFKCPFDGCEFSSLTKGNCIIHCLRIHYREEMEEIMQVHDETKTITCTECDQEFHNSCSFYYHAKQCFPFDTTDEKYNHVKTLLA